MVCQDRWSLMAVVSQDSHCMPVRMHVYQIVAFGKIKVFLNVVTLRQEAVDTPIQTLILACLCQFFHGYQILCILYTPCSTDVPLVFHCNTLSTLFWVTYEIKSIYWARPGFEPGTSRTRSENHTPRPTSHVFLVMVSLSCLSKQAPSLFSKWYS